MWTAPISFPLLFSATSWAVMVMGNAAFGTGRPQEWWPNGRRTRKRVLQQFGIPMKLQRWPLQDEMDLKSSGTKNKKINNKSPLILFTKKVNQYIQEFIFNKKVFFQTTVTFKDYIIFFKVAELVPKCGIPLKLYRWPLQNGIDKKEKRKINKKNPFSTDIQSMYFQF